MKVEELREVLKPLIKKCIKEMLFEEGFLSSIIKECVNGVSESSVPLVESRTKRNPNPQEQQLRQIKTRPDLSEKKKSLLETIGKDAYGGVDVFAGLQPLNESQGARAASAPSNESGVPSPFSAIERFPGDEGESLEMLSEKFGLGNMKFKI